MLKPLADTGAGEGYHTDPKRDKTIMDPAVVYKTKQDKTTFYIYNNFRDEDYTVYRVR